MGRRWDGEHWSVQRLGWHGQRICEAMRLTRRCSGGSRRGASSTGAVDTQLAEMVVGQSGGIQAKATSMHSFLVKTAATTIAPRGYARICKEQGVNMSEGGVFAGA